MWLLTALFGNSRADAQLLSIVANRAGTVSDVQQLLARGADPNAPDYRDEAREGYEGQIALHYAATWHEPDRGDLVRLLLKAGADPSIRSRFGHTPLHYFALYGGIAEIGELLDAGADVNAFNKVGHTPLHYAAANAQVEAARVLLERGADPNSNRPKKIRRWGGDTPILMAVSHQTNIEPRLEVMKLLICKGAHLTKIGDGTETALDKAKVWLESKKKHHSDEEDRERSIINLERIISLLERESSSVSDGISVSATQ
jgi:ankyrin repeat protein